MRHCYLKYLSNMFYVSIQLSVVVFFFKLIRVCFNCALLTHALRKDVLTCFIEKHRRSFPEERLQKIVTITLLLFLIIISLVLGYKTDNVNIVDLSRTNITVYLVCKNVSFNSLSLICCFYFQSYYRFH